jgi:uncharacterized tellurite resistance protein B-like protein
MFQRVTQYFQDRPQAEDPAQTVDARHVAAAALMVEAARRDGLFDAAEHDAIVRLLKSHFKLPQAEADELLAVAERRERLVMNNWIFYENIKRGFSAAEREAIVGDLWQLAFTDKALNRFEEVLIETIAHNIDVTATACAAQRDRARLRAGA